MAKFLSILLYLQGTKLYKFPSISPFTPFLCRRGTLRIVTLPTRTFPSNYHFPIRNVAGKKCLFTHSKWKYVTVKSNSPSPFPAERDKCHTAFSGPERRLVRREVIVIISSSTFHVVYFPLPSQTHPIRDFSCRD